MEFSSFCLKIPKPETRNSRLLNDITFYEFQKQPRARAQNVWREYYSTLLLRARKKSISSTGERLRNLAGREVEVGEARVRADKAVPLAEARTTFAVRWINFRFSINLYRATHSTQPMYESALFPVSHFRVYAKAAAVARRHDVARKIKCRKRDYFARART